MRRRLLCAGALLAVACARSHAVQLYFAHVSPVDGGIPNADLPSGLHCTEGRLGGDSGIPCPLVLRSDGGQCAPTATDPTEQFTVVVDFLQLAAGAPSSTPLTVELFTWCNADPTHCPLIPGTRRCLPVTLSSARSLFNDAGMAPALTAALEALDGGLVSLDAPGGQLLVRAVATREGCPAETQPGFELGQLIGCAHSTPVVLSETPSVELFLTASTPGNYCDCYAALCANAPGCNYTTP